MAYSHSRLQEIADQCIRTGLRFTPLRQAVMQLILESSTPVKAYDILTTLQAQRRSAAPPTVYRTLNFLIKEGFVHKVEALNAFIACDHVHRHDKDVLLICEHCQQVVEVEHSPLPSTFAQIAVAVGFMPTIYKIELTGVCASCHKKFPHEKN